MRWSKSAVPSTDPNDGLVSVQKKTVYRWLKSWREQGPAGLEPAERERAASIALPPRLLEFLKREPVADPQASIPELLKRAAADSIIQSASMIDRTTAWRAMRRMGLATRPRRSKKEADADASSTLTG